MQKRGVGGFGDEATRGKTAVVCDMPRRKSDQASEKVGVVGAVGDEAKGKVGAVGDEAKGKVGAVGDEPRRNGEEARGEVSMVGAVGDKAKRKGEEARGKRKRNETRGKGDAAGDMTRRKGVEAREQADLVADGEAGVSFDVLSNRITRTTGALRSDNSKASALVSIGGIGNEASGKAGALLSNNTKASAVVSFGGGIGNEAAGKAGALSNNSEASAVVSFGWIGNKAAGKAGALSAGDGAVGLSLGTISNEPTPKTGAINDNTKGEVLVSFCVNSNAAGKASSSVGDGAEDVTHNDGTIIRQSKTSVSLDKAGDDQAMAHDEVLILAEWKHVQEFVKMYEGNGDVKAKLSGVPSLNQAEMFLSALAEQGLRIRNYELLRHLKAACLVLCEVKNETITLLRYQPSSPAGKAKLLRQARQLDGIGNMVAGNFKSKAKELAAEMQSYAEIRGHPKSDPQLFNLRMEVQRLLNEEVVFP